MKKLFESKLEIFVSIALLAATAVISIPHLLERGTHLKGSFEEKREIDRKLFLFYQHPVENHEAARWFAQLPFDKKREYAQRIGRIIFVDKEGGDFIFSMGSDRPPYPWVLECLSDGNNLDLYANCDFMLCYRDDEAVKGEYGIVWVRDQLYETKDTGDGPIFKFNPDLIRCIGWFNWLDSTNRWIYKGPPLVEKDFPGGGDTPGGPPDFFIPPEDK